MERQLHAHGLVVLTVIQHCLEEKKSPEVLVIVKGSIVICEKVLWL